MVLCASGASFVGACAAAIEEDSLEHENKIYGGVIDASHQAVAKIETPLRSLLCTATYVGCVESTGWAVSAAHCRQALTSLRFSVPIAKGTETRLGVRKWHLHPDYVELHFVLRNETPGSIMYNDVALLELEGCADVEPIPIAGVTALGGNRCLPVEANSEVTLSGYGYTNLYESCKDELRKDGMDCPETYTWPESCARGVQSCIRRRSDSSCDISWQCLVRNHPEHGKLNCGEQKRSCRIPNDAIPKRRLSGVSQVAQVYEDALALPPGLPNPGQGDSGGPMLSQVKAGACLVGTYAYGAGYNDFIGRRRGGVYMRARAFEPFFTAVLGRRMPPRQRFMCTPPQRLCRSGTRCDLPRPKYSYESLETDCQADGSCNPGCSILDPDCAHRSCDTIWPDTI